MGEANLSHLMKIAIESPKTLSDDDNIWSSHEEFVIDIK